MGIIEKSGERPGVISEISKEPQLGMSEVDDIFHSRCHVFLVLPCYNEEGNLPQLMSDVSGELTDRFSFDIVVINDGSSDRSEALLWQLSVKYPLRIITHKKNLGLSATLKDGLVYAASCARSEDVIITMDADNTQQASYIPRMIEAVEDGADFVIASRYASGGSQLAVPCNRVILSRGANYLIRHLSGLRRVGDTTSGYRCYKASLLKKATERYNSHLIDSKGFEVQVELLVKLAIMSNRISEIPFVLRYDKKKGESKMSMMKTIGNYIILFLKIVAWRNRKILERADDSANLKGS